MMDNKSFDPWINLNVGGTLFRTRKSTLTSSVTPNMFTAMFGGQFMAEPDSNGHYCFDRDPTHFRKILNFLRSGQMVMPNEKDIESARELLIECQFYSIEPYINKLTEFLGVGLPTGDRFLRLKGTSGISFPHLEWRGGPVTVEYWHRCSSDVVAATLYNFDAFIHDETTEAEYHTHRFMNHTPWSDGCLYYDYGGVKENWERQGRISVHNSATFYKRWNHFAYVSEGASGNETRLYLNGRLVLKAEHSDECSPCRNFILGGAHKGDLAHFRIWKTARSEEDIQETMKSVLSGREENLFFYLPLNDQTHGSIVDLVSGNSAQFDHTTAALESEL